MSEHRLTVARWREHLAQEIVIRPPRLDIPPEEARGRVLAADVISPEDVPALPVAAMDGFAVRRSDLATGGIVLPVSTDLPARPGHPVHLREGSAARIMTGAPVPVGADVVIQVESTDADPFAPAPAQVRITLDAVPAAGRHIRDRGEETARGSAIALAGDTVGAGLIGIARSLGIATLPVLAPPRIAVVVTGDELVGPGASGEPAASSGEPAADTAMGPAGSTARATSGAASAAVGAASGAAVGVGAATGHERLPGTVRESNGTMLAAALRADGADVSAWRSGDDPEALRTVLAEAARSADLVITTGGVGQGAYDVVKNLLGPRGENSSRFEHLALQPGGPQGAGHLPAALGDPTAGTPIVHLPGTPVGAFVGLHLFVRPLLPGADAAIRRMPLGVDDEAGPGGRRARRARPGISARPGRRRIDEEGIEVVDIVPGSRLTPFARADAIVLRERPSHGAPASGSASTVPGSASTVPGSASRVAGSASRAAIDADESLSPFSSPSGDRVYVQVIPL